MLSKTECPVLYKSFALICQHGGYYLLYSMLQCPTWIENDTQWERTFSCCGDVNLSSPPCWANRVFGLQIIGSMVNLQHERPCNMKIRFYFNAKEDCPVKNKLSIKCELSSKCFKFCEFFGFGFFLFCLRQGLLFFFRFCCILTSKTHLKCEIFLEYVRPNMLKLS